MRIAKFAVTLFAVTTFAVSSHAATYFVATNGNDANTGTLAAPFRTITKASGVTKAGDIVEVRGGVYSELVKISAKGTSAAPIIFRSYANETAIIDGSATAVDSNLVTIANATYVEFSKFEVRNAKRAGICGYPANNVKITNNAIHHSERNGIYLGSTSTDVTIEGNAVYNNVLHNQYHTMTGGWGQAIGVSNSPRTTIRSNRVYENDGEGIVILIGDDGLIEKNEVRDNFSVGIYLDNAQNTKVNANFIYSTGNTRYYRSSHPASGIATANETYATQNPLDGLTITNNIVVNSKYGFYYSNEEFGGGLKNSLIANNTFHKATQAMIWLAAAAHTGTTVENNIFSQTGATMTNVAGTGVTYRANNWYGGTPGAASGAGDAIGDPRFVNAAGLSANDYRIALGSMAAGRGVTLNSLLSTDYFGAARGLTFDIGAHQFTNSAAAVTDATAPSAPSSLNATVASSTSIKLTWNSATDNVGVSGYRIYRRGALVATVTTPTWTDTNLIEGNSYSYQVFAIDAAGNVSAGSELVSISPAGSTAPKKSRSVKH
ncbi:MAG TPA: right-handed parallel beta-helix repeat-containing protein [Thermoanaerobaculia bacterium]